jgi:hypothetical protein
MLTPTSLNSNAKNPVSLAMALGLCPLDRVMISSQAVLRECRILSSSKAGRLIDLPFWYFQLVTAEGELLLRSPGGHAVRISPLDVCDIIKGKPIKVMAMPLSTWLARSRLPLKDRQQQRPGPDCYAPASVLHAHKDRWGQCSYYVRFDCPEVNAPSDGTTRHAPLCDEDHRELPKRTRRTAMPVTSWPNGAAWSADHGVGHASATVERDTQDFFKAALQGQASVASELASKDAIEMRHRTRKANRTQLGSMT